MRPWLAIALLLASVAVALPAAATPGGFAPPGSASDTDRAPAVHRRDGWNCALTVCASTGDASSWSAALGFASAALVAAGIARRRPPAAE